MSKTHHCFNCGSETDSWDEIDGTRIYICDDPKCIKEYRYQSEAAENEKKGEQKRIIMIDIKPRKGTPTKN